MKLKRRYIRSSSDVGGMIKRAVEDAVSGINYRVSREELDEILRDRLTDAAKNIANDLGVPNAWKKLYDSIDPIREEYVEKLVKLNEERRRALKSTKKTMNSNISDWYISEYPDDSEGEYINTDVTFNDLFDALDTYKDIYNVIGTGDSVVRERVFEKLAELMGVDYDYIYDQWMLASK